MIDDNRDRTVTYVTDAEGRVLSRSENDNDSATTDPRTVSLFFDGVQVGEVTNDGSGRGDYAAVLARRSAEMVRTPKRATEAARSSFRNGRPVNTADFDQAFQPISPESGAATAGTWTVREGDSLQAIAVAAWGDASLWWVIAEANGLDGAAPLQAGTSLSLPAGVRSAGNTAETSRPYHPNRALGDVMPNDPPGDLQGQTLHRPGRVEQARGLRDASLPRLRRPETSRRWTDSTRQRKKRP